MEISKYFLSRPPMDIEPEMLAAFDGLYRRQVEHGDGSEIEYTLAAPKWQFLCYLADTKDVLMHGSGSPDIVEFEPRQSNDIDEFGNRKAVYAASDALWAMYFAIVDREQYVRSLINACFSVTEQDGRKHGAYYFFSINDDALPHTPWRNGTMYILPRDTFEHQASYPEQDVEIEIAQWASLVEVKPLAKIAVTPEDFPFLSRVRGHDVKVV